MKLTWTFYLKGQHSITLTVIYVPTLDKTSGVGYLDVTSNTAFVNWTGFRIFDTGDHSTKRALFGELIRVASFEPPTLDSPQTE